MVTGREVEVPASVLLACTVVPVVMMEAGHAEADQRV